MLNINVDIDKTLYVETEVLEELQDLYLSQMHKSIVERLDKVVAGMSYKNFVDEAKDYIKENKIEDTPENLILYSKLIYKSFTENYGNLISVDLDTKEVYISETFMDFEYGTAFKPASMLLTKALEDCFNELEG